MDHSLKDSLWELADLVGGFAALLLPFTVLAPGALILVVVLAIPVAAIVLTVVLLGAAIWLPSIALRSLGRALTGRRARPVGALQGA